MARAEDLAGRTFGFLKVINRAENMMVGGQSKVAWLCECKCGNQKIVAAYDLKREAVTSCGCRRAEDGKRKRNRKVCVVCGREFESPPSDKTVTCSPECRKIRASEMHIGKTFTAEAREKMSERAKGRNLSDFQKAGTEAAKVSPKSGRFETNINAKDWHLISPEGKHYYFHSLNFWLREHCRELFGCEPDSQEYRNVQSGLCGAKRATLGKKYGYCTYKGWQVLPTEDDAEKYDKI